jgi:hypothetical protein
MLTAPPTSRIADCTPPIADIVVAVVVVRAVVDEPRPLLPRGHVHPHVQTDGFRVVLPQELPGSRRDDLPRFHHHQQQGDAGGEEETEKGEEEEEGGGVRRTAKAIRSGAIDGRDEDDDDGGGDEVAFLLRVEFDLPSRLHYSDAT